MFGGTGWSEMIGKAWLEIATQSISGHSGQTEYAPTERLVGLQSIRARLKQDLGAIRMIYNTVILSLWAF